MAGLVPVEGSGVCLVTWLGPVVGPVPRWVSRLGTKSSTVAGGGWMLHCCVGIPFYFSCSITRSSRWTLTVQNHWSGVKV